ncbi:MAG TPA: hypothetical protein VFH83_10345 [Spirochaetia bacterium]|nr:hypothetical protein [Spirochaetia bacterium]
MTGRRASLGVALGIALGLVPLQAGAQAVAGGELNLGVSALVDPSQPLASSIDDAIVFYPTIHVEDPAWRLDGKLSLEWDRAAVAPSLGIRDLYIELSPAGFLTLRLGRFVYAPGSAGVLSPTHWFVTPDLLALVRNDTESLVRGGDLVQGILTLGDWSLTLSASPFAPAWSIPDPSSPWFPKKDFPRNLTIFFPTTQVVSLTGITVEPTPATQFSLTDVSVGAELGVSLPLLDLSLLAYHGWDTTPLYQPSFEFPNGFFGDYDIILTPVARKIDSIGAEATLSWGSLSAWADGAYTFSKTFLSRKLSSSTYASDLVTSPCLEYAAGAGYDFSAPRLSLQAGYRGLWVTQSTAETILPFLGSYLNGTCALRLWDDRLSVATQALVSTVDWSAAIIGLLSIAPTNELSFDVVLPFFLGASDTELGQFAANYLVSIGVTVRY